MAARLLNEEFVDQILLTGTSSFSSAHLHYDEKEWVTLTVASADAATPPVSLDAKGNRFGACERGNTKK